MAVSVLTDAMVIINGVTLSDHANQITINDTRDSVEITSFGAVNKAYTKGLGDATISGAFFQDFAAGKTHATLQPLLSSSTPVTIEVRPTSGARSATNPAAVMSGLLMSYNMVDGGVGAASTTQFSFMNGAQSGVQYLTS